MPFSTLSVARGAWVLSATWCRSQSYLLVVLLVAQHYSLLAISLDRHYAISNSLRYPYVFTHTLGNRGQNIKDSDMRIMSYLEP